MLLNHCPDKSNLRIASQHLFGMLILACCTFAMALPAFGEVYKWADEGGVVHYSSVPPEKLKTKVKRIENSELAVPQGKMPAQDAAVHPEVQAAQELAGKVDDLQRQVDAEHQARQTADAQNLATQAAYAQSLADQQAARNAAYIPTIPAVSGVLFLPEQHRRHDNPCRGVAGMMTNCPPQRVDHDGHKFDHGKPLPGVQH